MIGSRMPLWKTWISSAIGELASLHADLARRGMAVARRLRGERRSARARAANAVPCDEVAGSEISAPDASYAKF